MTPHSNQHPHDTRNLILAIAIGMGIMVGWQYFIEQPRVEAQQQYLAQQKEKREAVAKTEPGEDARPSVPNASAALPRQELIAADGGARLNIASKSLHGTLTLKGARFDDLTLAGYRVTRDKNSPEVVLFAPSRSKEAYFSEFGWLAANNAVQVPGPDTHWDATNAELTPKQPVELYWKSAQNITFTKKIALDPHYLFTVTLSVTNDSGKPVTLYPYGLIQRTFDGSDHPPLALLHEGPIGVFGETLENISYDDLKEDGPQSYDTPRGWVGFTDKYWLAAMVPDKDHPFAATVKHIKGNRFQADYRGEALTVAPGETVRLTNRLFAGAKKVDVLDEYRDAFDIPLFDRAIDFGWFYFLTKPIFHLLNFVYAFVGNFGVAILVLTVLVKLLMYPLANKSYTSMSQMKILMPKVQELQKRHGDDKLKMNTELMELYKREKINPMSGCLPILVQIPVFFALYKVLFVTIEMRHAPFFGWIQDLSAADPTNVFTLFGLIPWDAPDFLHIGVWPLIMTLTMVIQQRLNPKPTDPVQATVIQYMPFVFLFLFANFPAGLVVYWAWNNTLSIVQQRYIQWKLEHKKKKAA
jgi:YidC/Oxa1 family membrane protein insertase